MHQLFITGRRSRLGVGDECKAAEQAAFKLFIAGSGPSSLSFPIPVCRTKDEMSVAIPVPGTSRGMLHAPNGELDAIGSLIKMVN